MWAVNHSMWAGLLIVGKVNMMVHKSEMCSLLEVPTWAVEVFVSVKRI